MKFFILFCSVIIILAHYTEQQIVMLKPGKPHEEKSHEVQQLDPDFRDGLDNISAQMGEDSNGDEPGGDNPNKNELSENDPSENGPSGNDPSENEPSGNEPSGNEASENEPSGNEPNLNEPSVDSIANSQSSEGDFSEENSAPSDSLDSTKHPGDEGMLLILQYANKDKKPGTFDDDKVRHWNQWVSEIARGNKGDIIGTNPHTYQPSTYTDFGRRFVPVYPYTEEPQNIIAAPDNKEIIPIPAPLEVVKMVAKESAMKEAAKPKDDTQDLMRNKILRTGDYWNAVWIEEVEPKAALRTSPNVKPVLNTIKAKIKPGSEFYDVVANMTKISPKLLYIINEDKKAS